MDDLFRLTGAVKRDPKIAAWFDGRVDPFRLMVRPWFERMRTSGPDVRELFHDSCPVVLVADVPFAYVNAFKAHAAVGLFRGADLPDPAGLLEGTGKTMRHVKLRPAVVVDEAALTKLVTAAYADIRRCL